MLEFADVGLLACIDLSSDEFVGMLELAGRLEFAGMLELLLRDTL